MNDNTYAVPGDEQVSGFLEECFNQGMGPEEASGFLLEYMAPGEGSGHVS